MKQNQIQNIIENATLIADMDEQQLKDYYTFSEVITTRQLICESLTQLPISRDTAVFLTCLARDIRGHIHFINSKCDDGTSVDA